MYLFSQVHHRHHRFHIHLLKWISATVAFWHRMRISTPHRISFPLLRARMKAHHRCKEKYSDHRISFPRKPMAQSMYLSNRYRYRFSSFSQDDRVPVLSLSSDSMHHNIMPLVGVLGRRNKFCLRTLRHRTRNNWTRRPRATSCRSSAPYRAEFHGTGGTRQNLPHRKQPVLRLSAILQALSYSGLTSPHGVGRIPRQT